MPFELMPLPYAKDALEPYMSKETVDYHYEKHHKKYVENLNKLIKNTAYENDTLLNIVEASKSQYKNADIFNNAAQVWNHDFFWNSMVPTTSYSISTVALQRLSDAFGSLSSFKEQFVETAKKEFGSGWIWLVMDSSKQLLITKTHDAYNPIVEGPHTPLLCCDVWEHAYYLDYKNRRELMVMNFLNKLANWKFFEQNLDKALNLIF